MNTNNKFKLIIAIVFSICIIKVHAQETVSATGGDGLGSGGTVSFSVGQINYTTNVGVNGLVSQGVQQPFEISIVTAVELSNETNLEIVAYPNPINSFLILKIENFHQLNLSYHLYDFLGKLLLEEHVNADKSIIKTELLPKAIYFLKITNNSKPIKTFKIIKN